MSSQELEFLPVPGFTGYAVNRVGQVRGKFGRVLAPSPNSNGYPSCYLYEEGKQSTCTVHSLVMLTFVGPRPEGRECNHVDGDKTNNRVENLEWVTHSQNVLHALHVLKFHKSRKLTTEQVHRIRASSEGTPGLAVKFRVSPQTIWDIRARRRWGWLVKKRSQEPTPNDGPPDVDS